MHGSLHCWPPDADGLGEPGPSGLAEPERVAKIRAAAAVLDPETMRNAPQHLDTQTYKARMYI